MKPDRAARNLVIAAACAAGIPLRVIARGLGLSASHVCSICAEARRRFERSKKSLTPHTVDSGARWHRGK